MLLSRKQRDDLSKKALRFAIGNIPEKKGTDISMVTSRIPELNPSRYVPFVLKDTVLAVWYDNEKELHIVLCPQCHEMISYPALNALYREMVWGDRQCCQGCRARITFEKDPGLIGLFLDFWHRTGKFPESDSWVEAVPQPQLILWGKDIRTALKATQMKGEGQE